MPVPCAGPVAGSATASCCITSSWWLVQSKELRHIHAVWMQMVITKANALLKLKEVGSHSKDTTRCIDLAHALST